VQTMIYPNIKTYYKEVCPRADFLIFKVYKERNQRKERKRVGELMSVLFQFKRIQRIDIQERNM